jgi:hypothetical protein
LAGLATHNVDIYVEGLQADPDFSLTYGYVTGSLGQGSVQGSASVHIAVADVSLVGAGGQPLGGATFDLSVSDILVPADASSVSDLYDAVESAGYRVQVSGLQSEEIQQLVVSSPAGGQYQDTLTDTSSGAESSLLGLLVDNGGAALDQTQQSQIDSLLGVHALGLSEADQTVQSVSGQSQLCLAISADAPAVPAGGSGITVQLQTNGGKDKHSVTIKAVPMWTRAGDWTMTSASVVAGIDGASLTQLAFDITGSSGDFWRLNAANPGIAATVARGTTVDVLALLQVLEKRLRSNVVRAANADQSLRATFPQGNDAYSRGSNMTEEDVNAVFAGGTACLDCYGMTLVVMARGLITTIKPGEFDAIFHTTTGTFGSTTDTGIPFADTTVDLADTSLGDWLYFKNDSRYVDDDRHPNGSFRGENVIEVISSPPQGTDRFWGWGGETAVQTYDGWRATLIAEYNRGLPDGDHITNVPGYTGKASFFDVAKVAEDLFKYRSGMN